MLLIKACLRSIHKFHITAMSEAGSRQRLQNLEAERVGAHAFVGQCARLNAVMPGCGTDIDRLLNSIPSSERDHFVTQGLRFTEVAGYHDVFVKMQCLEVLATIPCSERDHFVTQGLRLTEMLRGYSIARPLRVLSAVTDAQRKEFVTQALRVFEIINRNSDRVLVLEVLAEIPQDQIEERVTRANIQLPIVFPIRTERSTAFYNRLRELLITPNAGPIRALSM